MQKILSNLVKGWHKNDTYHLALQKSVALCSQCLGTAVKNVSGLPEDLSSCSICGSSVHLSCVPHPTELTTVLEKGNVWCCEDCQVCNQCANQSDDQVIINTNRLYWYISICG